MTQWGAKNSLEFYLQNRSKKKDLYKSEIVLLKKIKKSKIKNILDIGCASGGFYLIFKEMFKNIKYYGIDIEPKMITIAKKRFNQNKRANFLVSKKPKINYKNNNFDLVFSTGTMNHNSNYKKIISEMLRVSKKYCFIDSPRVYFGKNFSAKLDLTKRFPSNIKKRNIVTNFTINLENYLKSLKILFNRSNIKKVNFYLNQLPYKKKYLKTDKKIYFLTMLCEKDSSINDFKYKLLTNVSKAKKIFSNTFNK